MEAHANKMRRAYNHREQHPPKKLHMVCIYVRQTPARTGQLPNKTNVQRTAENKQERHLDRLHSPLRVQLRHSLLVYGPVIVVVVDHVPPLHERTYTRREGCGMLFSGRDNVARALSLVVLIETVDHDALHEVEARKG